MMFSAHLRFDRLMAQFWRLTIKKSMMEAPRGYLIWAIQNGNRHMRYLAWEEVARRAPSWSANYIHWFYEWSNCISKEFDAEVSQKRYDAWTVVWAIDRQNDEKQWTEKCERKALRGTPREKEDYSE